MKWLWPGGIACWTLGCAACLAAFSVHLGAWAALLATGAAVTAAWLGMGVGLTLQRRWSKATLLGWGVWPAAVGITATLLVTSLPMTVRVIASEGALNDFAQAARASGPRSGRAGLVQVLDTDVADGCVWLTAGNSLDGITGIVQAPAGIEPGAHPGYPLTDVRHLTGRWWYFETRT